MNAPFPRISFAITWYCYELVVAFQNAHESFVAPLSQILSQRTSKHALLFPVVIIFYICHVNSTLLKAGASSGSITNFMHA
jgi:hypothetical protein